MRAWTVDADDIRVAEDFDESLLHRTPEIDGFLTPGRDDKFIIIGHLVPRLRTLNASLAIFIDGIDEYFNKNVEEQPSSASVTGELSPNVWYFAQLGLVEVAYQLRRINHRLKVFAAIRKEAYARLPQRTAMVQQYRGSAVDIVYSPESLREILVNNVRLVKTDRMVQPDRARAHPLQAFLGRSGVTDTYTHEEEDAFEFVCRHTLLRPRDLMTIGERLVALRSDERRNEHRLMEAVHQAASEIAHEYLVEIAPYIGNLALERLFRRLPGHILTRAEVEDIFEEHMAEASEGKYAFSALYRVGLLGYVQHDRVRGEWRQRFLRPGEATLEPNGNLPHATHYLIHPVLTDVIGRLNPGFLQRIDRLNIVGYDRPWHDPIDVVRSANVRQCCVLKADVHGFGSMMRAGVDGPIRKALEEAVSRWASPTAIAETGGGDAALVADDDPVALAQTARHLMDEVYQAPGQPRLRVALHYGEVHTRQRDSDLRIIIVGGDAILCAARVEPIVEPGQIWATEQFREQFLQRPSLWRTVPVAAASGEDRFNVSKTHTGEPDLWVRLFRLES